MQLAKFIYSAAKEHNTSLGNNKALPQREDVSYEYIMLKRRFKQVVEQIEKTFGHIPSVDEAEHLLSKLIVKTQKLEEPLRPQLEKLCEAVVTNVLSVPQETILLECNLVSEIEPEQEIRILPEFDDEESGYDFSDVDEVTMANEAILKRRMVNSLVQGVSYLLMMDNFDNTKLSEWSNELSQLYMQIIALNDYLLYSKQEKISDKNPMLGAYVETHLGKGDEKTVITSQGLIYPLLLQETFRGFFELFGSHGLPDKTDAAMYVIKHADFIVAEAWDLRIGVPLWETIENCCGTVEPSIYPYIFSSIAELPIEDFNKTLQNILLNTKSGKKFVDDIVREVKHDKEYNLFKQDLERFNLEKCVINDEENSDEGLLKEEEIDNKFIHSDKFKAWFGDWESGSKDCSYVIGQHGIPLVCHHSTDKEFDQFDPNRIGSGGAGAYHGYGFNFTTQPNTTYGKFTKQVYLNARHPLASNQKTLSVKDIMSIMMKIDEGEMDSISCEFTGNYVKIGSLGYRREIEKAARLLYEYADGDLDIYSNISIASSCDPKKIIDIFSSYGFDSAAEYYEDGPLRVVVVFNTSQIMFVPQGINESQTITGDNSVKSWFAGSKVVNPDGSPKLMYRGDENQIDSFDRSYSSSSNLYGSGFYFTDSKSHAMQYGHAQPYYLKITHPLSTDGHEITKKQMYDFLVAVDENDDYGLYNYGYGANPRTVLSSIWGKSDFAMLLDVNACCIGDLVNATLLFNEVNGTDFDGFILDTETVVFDNSQIYPVKNGITESKQSLINEGISDVTYHFCSLPSLHSILESGKLALTMSSNMADAYHKTNLFYLSTQRSKSSRLGYAGNSSGHGRNPIARIELDGDMLKRAGFQGKPLDYWGASMGKQSDIGLNSSRLQAQFAGGKDFHPETQEDKETILKSQQTSSNFEFEDRIFSNKPSMSLTYIKRIDCLVPGGKITPIEKSILQLAENRGVLVSFYDNEKDFVRETTNTLNQQILNSEGEYENQRLGKPDEERLAYNAKTVATLSAILLYYSYYNNMVNGVPGEKTLTKLNNALSKFGLERYYNYCVKELPKIAMFLEENIGTSFEDSLRKANTNDLTKNSLSDNVMSYAQYVFNHYGVNSCRALRMYFKNHPYQSKKPKNIQLQEKVQCVEINYGGSSAMIYRADTSPFWGRWFDKDMFYQDISRQLEEDDWNEQNGYGDDRSIHHKSKDSQSFLKYIQHLTHNDNLSLYDGAIILNKIFNYDQGKISTMFGFTIKPVEVDREYFKQNENRFSFEDGQSVKESLFGSDKAYLDWLFPKE